MTQVYFTMNHEEIQNLIASNVPDQLAKSLLTTVFQSLMEKQRDDYIAVGSHERSEERVSHRNGYYDRTYVTRVGALELRVPRTRDSEFSPTLFERYERHEKALLSSLVEMYVSGFSTRSITKVVEELCGTKVSKSFVSSLTKRLDAEVEAFQNQELEKNYPYLMVDVLYLKVRENHKVISKSLHIAIGITEEGRREIIGFQVNEGESEDTWTNFFAYLKAKKLTGVELVISDAHKGLVKAIRSQFTGASWQRDVRYTFYITF